LFKKWLEADLEDKNFAGQRLHWNDPLTSIKLLLGTLGLLISCEISDPLLVLLKLDFLGCSKGCDGLLFLFLECLVL